MIWEPENEENNNAWLIKQNIDSTMQFDKIISMLYKQL